MNPDPQLRAEERQAVEEFRRRHRTALLALLFTDVERSTALRSEMGELPASALFEQHRQIIRGLLAEFAEAQEISTAGDSFFIVFAKPSDAVRFTLLAQLRLRELAAQTRLGFSVRMGIHLGEVAVEEEGEGGTVRDVLGMQVDMAARVCALGMGGQILMTRGVFDNARQILKGQHLVGVGDLLWLSHGPYLLKGFDEPLAICEVGEVGLAPLRQPADCAVAKRAAVPGTDVILGWQPAVEQVVPATEWVLEEKLGEGMFGEVWVARHQKEGERQAFKFYSRNEAIQLMKSRKRLVDLLQDKLCTHPGIAQIRNLHLNEPPYYVRMEYVKGENFASWWGAHRRAGRWPVEAGLRVLSYIADALHAAHAAGLVHGNVKPSNIIVAEGGGSAENIKAKLTDFGFGIGPSSETGQLSSSLSSFVTPFYLSPEQIKAGSRVGPAADVYALGVILYELLTGHPPFAGPDSHAVLHAHLREDPQLPSIENPEVPDGLQRVCLKAIEKAPEDRYESAGSMARDLRRFLAGEPVHTRPKVYDSLIRSRVRSHMDDIASWYRQHLLTGPEYADVTRAYQRLDRSGLQAVMESRIVHFGVLVLFLGGWLTLHGCSIWLVNHWDSLASRARILLGFLPAVLSNGLWAIFWRRGSYRCAFATMIVAVLSLPFAIGVFLHEFEWLRYDLYGREWSWSGEIHNAQMLVILGVSLTWAIVLTYRTGTVLVSGLSVLYLVLLYIVVLDLADLPTMLEDRRAMVALRTVPLIALTLSAGGILGRIEARRSQAKPWFAMALVLLLAVSQVIAWDAPKEWVVDPFEKHYGKFVSEEFLRTVVKEAHEPLRGFFMMASGILYLSLGLLLRRKFLVEALAAYRLLLWLAPLSFLGGLAYMAFGWPETWLRFHLYGKEVPPPDVFLLVLSVSVFFWACRIQLRFYAFAGLLFAAVGFWRLGREYFAEIQAWPITILIAGLVLTALSLYIEARRWKSRRIEDMDDVAALSHAATNQSLPKE